MGVKSWLKTLPLKGPFHTTGKSKLYRCAAPDGRPAVAKVLTLRKEPWLSLFRWECRVARAMDSAGEKPRHPAFLGADLARGISVWESIEGKAAGKGRFYFSRTTRREAEALVGGLVSVRRFRPAGGVRKATAGPALGSYLPGLPRLTDAARTALRRHRGGLEFSHGDLTASNVLYSPKGPVYLDWEHAGLRPPAFDEAFLWALGAFAPAVRAAVLNAVGPRRRSIFWLNAIGIVRKELRLHAALKSGTGYRAEKSLGTIRKALQQSLDDAVSGFGMA